MPITAPVVPLEIDLPLPLYERLMAMCATDPGAAGKNPIAIMVAYIADGLLRDDLPAGLPPSSPGFDPSIPADYRPSNPYEGDVVETSDEVEPASRVVPDVVEPVVEAAPIAAAPHEPVGAPDDQEPPKAQGAPVRGRDGRIYDDLDL